MNTWMNRICQGLVVLVLGGAASLATAAEPSAQTAGPLSLIPVTLPPPFSAQEAAKRAAQYLGSSNAVSRAQFVQVSDSTRYGNIDKTVLYAWALTIPSVTVVNDTNQTQAAVDLTVLIDANTKGLDGVFTAVNTQTWVVRDPRVPARDLNQVMASDGWTLAQPASPTLTSTAAQVLSAFWSRTGLSPAEVGQVFLRPRQVSLALPAKWVGGKLTPLLPTQTYWTVQVSGTRVLEVTPPPSTVSAPSETLPLHMTGLIAVVGDTNAQVLRGIYLP